MTIRSWKKTLLNQVFPTFRASGWAFGFVLVSLIGLAGCAPAPEESAKMRAEARWKLVLNRDYEQAWEYLTPGFRQTTNRYDYARDRTARPFRYLGAAVTSEECQEDLCKIKILVRYRAFAAPSGMGKMNLSREIEETWIRVDGSWWLVEN